MTDFRIKHLFKSRLIDDGVSMSDLLGLLNLEDQLVTLLVEALNIKELEADFIDIPGAKTLVDMQKGINKLFHKEDLVSSLNDISIQYGDEFTLGFSNLEENEYFSTSGLQYLTAITKYSSKSDFFSWLYGMEKYANKLMDKGLVDILLQNIELLKQQAISEEKRKYRILHNLHTDEYFVSGKSHSNCPPLSNLK